jgi:hypothetical protein
MGGAVATASRHDEIAEINPPGSALDDDERPVDYMPSLSALGGATGRDKDCADKAAQGSTRIFLRPPRSSG